MSVDSENGFLISFLRLESVCCVEGKRLSFFFGLIAVLWRINFSGGGGGVRTAGEG